MKINLFNRYAEEICDLFGITEEQLFEKSKVQNLVDARHLLYYLCNEEQMRIRYIQEYMERRGYNIGHSNIIYGIHSTKKKVEEDSDYAIVISKLKRKAHEQDT